MEKFSYTLRHLVNFREVKTEYFISDFKMALTN